MIKIRWTRGQVKNNAPASQSERHTKVTNPNTLWPTHQCNTAFRETTVKHLINTNVATSKSPWSHDGMLD
jgi:hypothetical protein